MVQDDAGNDLAGHIVDAESHHVHTTDAVGDSIAVIRVGCLNRAPTASPISAFSGTERVVDPPSANTGASFTLRTVMVMSALAAAFEGSVAVTVTL